MRKRRRLEPAPLKEFLPDVLKGLRPQDRLGPVREAWAQIVGAAVARRTRLSGLENGQLRVLVASAALKHDLSTFRRQEVLTELARRLPEMRIRDVSYRVGSL